jgi:oxygen-dependent protoporphyrinogen oxidase
MLAARRMMDQSNNGSRPRLPMFMTLRGGMKQLIDALAAELDDDAVRLGSQAVSLHSLNAGGPPYEVRTQDDGSLLADALVLTTPSNVTSQLLETLDTELAKDLMGIRYVSTAVVSLGFRPQTNLKPLNGFGFIIPKTEGTRITACTWSSTKFDSRAPEGHQLLRCFVGGPGREEMVDLEDETLLNVVREELANIMGLRAEPALARIYRWRKLNPQYDLGHLDRVGQMRARAEKHSGLFLAGSSFDGVGVPDCVRQAEEAVDGIAANLKVTSPQVS